MDQSMQNILEISEIFPPSLLLHSEKGFVKVAREKNLLEDLSLARFYNKLQLYLQ